MSNFKRYMTYIPPFTGTLDEELENFTSHNFKSETVEWAGYMIDREICTYCGVGTASEESKYPCGERPEPVTWSEFVALMTACGRADEIP